LLIENNIKKFTQALSPKTMALTGDRKVDLETSLLIFLSDKDFDLSRNLPNSISIETSALLLI